jgi:hypothetical protein
MFERISDYVEYHATETPDSAASDHQPAGSFKENFVSYSQCQHRTVIEAMI